MDILVTYPDGTTELRAGNFPVRHPGQNYHPDLFGALGDTLLGSIADRRAWERATLYTATHSPRERCGRGSHRLVWRITGGRPEGESLTGEWQMAYVELVDEQLARLTRERDAAEKRIADLRAWAEQAEATSLDGIHVASDEAARERYRARRCAFARVVAKIDGKDG